MDALFSKYVFNFASPSKKPLFLANLLKKNKVHFQTKAENHFYKINKTESQLIQEIADSVTFKSDNFIVANKPYGLNSVTKKSLQESNFQHVLNENEYYIEDLLPEIAKKLGYNSLSLVKAPEKHSSGVMFLSTSQEGIGEVLTAASYIKKIGLHNYTYLVVTEHPIVLKQLQSKLAVEKVKYDGETVPLVLEKWSKNQVKKQIVKTFSWSHKVIVESDLASLIEVNLNLFQAYYVRLVLATKCYSPVLGDKQFRFRIKNLCGVPLLDDPKNCSKTPQKFRTSLLSALQIQDDEVNLIPTHVHLQAVQLWLNKKKVFVSVPPPESFNWTCKQLGLIHDDLRICENA